MCAVSLNDRRRATRDAYEVSSVRKALQILCSFTAQQPYWSLSELGRLLSLPKSTTHNLLHTLEKLEFVRQDPQDKRYRLGFKIYELGTLFPHATDLIAKSLPYLRQLAEQTGETVKLGVLSGGRVLVLAAVESSYELHTRGDNGSSWFLHSTSLGKAILAVLSPMEVAAIIDRHGLPRITNRTITNPQDLERSIEQIDKRGYAIDWQENERGVCCVAVPVPIPAGTAPVSLSVSGPSIRLSQQKLRDWVPLLADVAKMIGHLGGAQRDLATSSNYSQKYLKFSGQ